MDYGGAVKLIAAAKQAGISRYVIVSSMGADANAPGDDTFERLPAGQGQGRRRPARQRARLHGRPARRAHQRPGHRTRRPRATTVERGQVPRDDVAAVLAAVLAAPDTIGKTVELVSGDVPVEEAVAAL